MKKTRIILGATPSDCRIQVGDLELTEHLVIERMEVAPVDARNQERTRVTLVLLPDSVEIDSDNPQLVIDGQTFNLVPTEA